MMITTTDRARRFMGKPTVKTKAGVLLYLKSTGDMGFDTPFYPGYGEAPVDYSGYRILCANLAKLERGWNPSVGELTDAPMLDQWMLMRADDEPLCRIVGSASRPRGEVVQITTLMILACDSGLRWAMDRSSFYRLQL